MLVVSLRFKSNSFDSFCIYIDLIINDDFKICNSYDFHTNVHVHILNKLSWYTILSFTYFKDWFTLKKSYK